MMFLCKYAAVQELLRSDPIRFENPVKSTRELYARFWGPLDIGRTEGMELIGILRKIQQNDPEFFKYWVGNLVHHHDPAKVLRLFVEFSKIAMISDDMRYMLQDYGSARTSEKDGYYRDAEEWDEYLIDVFQAKEKITLSIGTGAGPGQMEAANRAGFKKKVMSVGFRLWLPNLEENANPYLTHMLFFTGFPPRLSNFQYSTMHKVTAGGAGTMDEFFGGLCLKAFGIRAGLLIGLQNHPVYKPGTTQLANPHSSERFYDALHRFIQGKMYREYGLLSDAESGMYTLLQTPEQAFEFYRKVRGLKGSKADEKFQTYPKFKSYQEENQKFVFKRTHKPVPTLFNKIRDLIEGGRDWERGVAHAAVWTFLNNHRKQNKRNEKYLHATTELAANQNIFRNKRRSVTIILPRKISSRRLDQALADLNHHLAEFRSPVAFDNQGPLVERVLKDYEPGRQRIRILDTVVSEDSQGGAVAQEYYPFKRHDIKKMIMVYSSHTFVLAPGGYESMDLLWHLLDIIQTKKIKVHKTPQIILWDPNGDFYSNWEKEWVDPLIERGMVNPNFKNLYRIERHLGEVIQVSNHRAIRVK